MTNLRIGHGYDVHRLVQGRRLVLGGVDIPWERGLDGHSDADVLVHAVMDALLGAAGLEDIGCLFPDGDDAYLGISSILLLQRVSALLKERGITVVNVDATLLAQRPKLAPYRQAVRENIARALDIPCRLSCTAGTYVCNDVFYRLLHRYRDTEKRVGFVHVPFLPEQGSPNLPLDSIVRALQAMLEAI